MSHLCVKSKGWCGCSSFGVERPKTRAVQDPIQINQTNQYNLNQLIKLIDTNPTFFGLTFWSNWIKLQNRKCNVIELGYESMC